MTTAQTLDLLRRFESRNVTFREPDGSWPIVWERARGCHVWDAEGRQYLDLTAAFGVAAAGHANPRVVRAGQRQMATLLHAMGDVHPHALKAQLAQELSELTFGRWARTGRGMRRAGTGKTIFGNSGFEAVEAALKTARLATGKPGVIAFEGGYHGLGYGALNTTHREHFRGPFRNQLREFAHFLPFPARAAGAGLASNAECRMRNAELEQLEATLRAAFRSHAIGAVLVEPVQARGGIRIPPPEFLPLLRRVADEHGALLILDEIYTGFGRTGTWFACEHSRVTPDLICLGKALTGGFPLSACVGRADLMDAAWPPATGEAIHTSTFLGHPVGCAMALAQLAELKAKQLVERSAKLGTWLAGELARYCELTKTEGKLAARGIGLMAGIEFTTPEGKPATELCLTLMKRLLARGFILLPEGEHANILSLTPPLTITEAQLRRTLRALFGEVERLTANPSRAQ
jgi:4-aminobutyrate aminotransferase-like enzyme